MQDPTRIERVVHFLSSSFIVIPWAAFAASWKWAVMRLMFKKDTATLKVIEKASGQSSDVLSWHASSRIHSGASMEQSLGSEFLPWEINFLFF